jgi:hypothetical protein
MRGRLSLFSSVKKNTDHQSHLRQPDNGGSDVAAVPRRAVGRNPEEAESSTATDCFASGPGLLPTGAGAPGTGPKAHFLGTFWGASQKVPRPEGAKPFPNKKAATGGLAHLFLLLFLFSPLRVCHQKREPVEKLRFSNFHALPAGVFFG